MESLCRKALGATLAAACIALAVTACATGKPTSAGQPQASSSRATSAAAAVDEAASAAGNLRPTPKQRAEAEAGAILKSFAVPPGGHRLPGPPSLPDGLLKTPLSYLGSNWEVHLTTFWAAPGNPQALLAWEQAHLPRQFTEGDASFGPPAWDREFQLAPSGVLVTRELEVETASAGLGQTAIRVDAWVAWQQSRSPGELVPSTARAVTLTELTYSSVERSVHGPVTITDPATVRKLVALIDALPLSTLPLGIPCPFSPLPYLSLTFRARPGGPALAVALTGQQCVSVTFTRDGRQEPPLADEPTLNNQILKLAGLPWKPN